MDNFRKTEGFGFKGFSKLKTGQDKGHRYQFVKLIETLKNGGAPLIPLEEIVNVTLASFAAIESLKTGVWVDVVLESHSATSQVRENVEEALAI
jgi:hypothetical protein